MYNPVYHCQSCLLSRVSFRLHVLKEPRRTPPQCCTLIKRQRKVLHECGYELQSCGCTKYQHFIITWASLSVLYRTWDESLTGDTVMGRRMNVAVTRARRHCAIVCHTETVSKDPFLGRLVEYLEANGMYLSAAELVPT